MDTYTDQVRRVVVQIPPGRVMSYGLIAEVVADLRELAGSPVAGGPRVVARVMSRHGAGLPWWRVVTASGHPPAAWADDVLARLDAEGVPLHTSAGGARRVDMAAAIWWPT